MFETKYSRMLTWFLIGGIVLVVLIFTIVAILIARNARLEEEAAEAAKSFQSEVGKSKNNDEEYDDLEAPDIDVNIQNIESINVIVPEISLNSNTISGNNNNKTSTQTYKGFPMVGTIEIPSINLTCPVLENTSKEALETSLTVYYGPGLNKVGNTTIAGHNYKNSTMLSNMKKIAEGDKIYITDTTGTKVTYIVYKAPYITGREDGSYLTRNTEGKREISLTSCTDDVKNVYVLWAREQ